MDNLVPPDTGAYRFLTGKNKQTKPPKGNKLKKTHQTTNASVEKFLSFKF